MIQNNGTTSKTLNLVIKDRLYFIDSEKVNVQTLGEYQGIYFSKPNTDQGLYFVVRGDEYANADQFNHVPTSQSLYTDVNKLDTTPYTAETQLLVAWKNRMIGETGIYHFYMTINDEFNIKPTPELKIDTIFNETYEKNQIIPIQGSLRGFEVGQVINIYYIYNEKQTTLAEFVVSEESDTFTIDFDLTLRNDVSNELFKLWIITKDAILTPPFAKWMPVCFKPEFRLLSPIDEKYYGGSRIYIDFEALSDGRAYMMAKWDEGNLFETGWDWWPSGRKTYSTNFIIDSYFPKGKHNLTLMVRNNYWVYSAPQTFEVEIINGRGFGFYFDNDPGGTRDFYETANVQLNLYTTYVNQNYSLYYRFKRKGFEWTKAYDFTVDQLIDNRFYKLSHQFKYPYVEGDDVIYYKVIDFNNVSTDIQGKSFTMNKKPKAYISKGFQNYFISGSKVNFTCFAVNLDPGKEATIYYELSSKYYFPVHDKAVMTDNYISNEITLEVEIPNVEGSYTLYLYARENTSTQARGDWSYYSMKFCTLPKFNITNELEEIYSLNGYIEVSLNCSTAIYSYLYYTFDNGNEISQGESIKTNGYQIVIKSIQLNNLPIGKHNITMFMVNEYGARSIENYTHEFDYDERRAPQLSVNWYHTPNRFCDLYGFTLYISEPDKDQRVDVYYWFNDNTPELLYSYNSSGYLSKWIQFYPYRVEGQQTLWVQAIDASGAKSKKESQVRNIYNEPRIEFINWPRDWFIVGENMTFRCKVTDLHEGEELTVFCDVFGQQTEVRHDPIIMPHSMSVEFDVNITIPKFNDNRYITFWATDNYPTKNVTNKFQTWSRITEIPKIVEISPLDPQYSIGEAITVELTVWDEDYLYVYYIFDEMDKGEDLGRVDTNGENKTVRYQIPTSNKIYNVGTKTLSIYLVDRWGFWSSTFKHQFTYENLRAPEFEINVLNKKNVFYYHETVNFRFKIRDRNYGDNVMMFMKINENDFENIFNATSYGDWFDYDYNFSYLPENKDYTLTFKTVDNSDSESLEKQYSFRVAQTATAVAATTLEKMYEPGTRVNVTCFAGDFNIGDKIQIYYQINNEKVIYPPCDLVISENYSTDYFTIEMELPSYPSRNSIYIYAKNDKNTVGQRAILYTTTNFAPKIIKIDDIKDEYASNEYIDIDCILYDDSFVELYYKFDSRELQKLENRISINGKETAVHRQIPIPKESFRGGNHKVFVHFVDQYGIATDVKNFSFIYNDKHAPEFNVVLLDMKQTYNFYESINFNCSVFDQDKDNTLKILLKVNDGEFSEIASTTSSENWYNYTHNFQIPDTNGSCVVRFIAQDNTGASSVDQIFTLNVQQSPIVILENDFSGSYNGGETILVTGFVADFDPGKGVQVMYSINSGQRVFATPIMNMRSDYKTDGFEFELNLPANVGTYSITFWAEDNNGMKSQYNRQFITINLSPRIVQWNDLDPIYYRNGFINFDAVIFDDSKSRIYYKFDNEEINLVGDWIEFNSRNVSIKKEIPIPNMTVGEHSITVYIKDWFGIKSTEETKTFQFSDKSVPVLKMRIVNQQYSYAFSESVEFSGQVSDSDEGDTIRVSVQINGGEFEQIASFSESQTVNEFNHKISLPKIDGSHTVIFKAFDGNGGESGEQRFVVNAKQQPHIVLTSEINKMYLPNETIFINGYIADFSPGEDVQLFYKLNDGIIVYAYLSMLSLDNYTTPMFDFNLTLPKEVKHNYLTIWAESSTGLASRRSYYDIITNREPVLNEFKPIKEFYTINEFIDLDLKITDDSKCKIVYYYDDEAEIVINEFIPIKSSEFPVLRHIPVKNSLAFGDHNLTVFIRDEFGSISNKISHNFTFKNSHAPELVLSALPKRPPYNFHESITFRGSVRDLDLGDTTRVVFKVGTSEPTMIYDGVSDKEWHDFSHTINVPHGNGKYTIVVAAMDQTGSKSEEVSLEFEVQRSKGIEFLTKFKKSYQPGEIIQMTSQLKDFDANSSVLFCYSIDGNGKNYIKEVEIFENYTSGLVDYEIPLPNELTDHYLILWAENELGHVLCPYNENYIIINNLPTFNITNTLPTNLYGHAFIEVDISCYDETDVWVYYMIDDKDEKLISSRIQSFFEIEKRVLSIEIKSLEVGEHKLSIYLKDEFEAYSIPYIHNFTYSDIYNPPVLNISSYIKPYTYGFFETIDVNASTFAAEGENVSLYMRLDYDEYEKIYEYTSTGDIHLYQHTIKMPTIEDFHFVTFVAMNQNEIKSKITKLDFEVRMNPGIEFSQSLKVSYKTDEEITLRGVIVDYQPFTRLDIYYKVDQEEKVFAGRVTVRNNFKSDEFEFTVVPNNTINIHDIKIWLEKDQQSVYSIAGNFIVNTKPVIKMWNSLNEKYYNNDHINLDFNATDNTQAKLCYNFDGKEEKCFTKLIYFYNREYQYRHQIEINTHVISYGEHTLNFYAKDEFGEISDIFSHNFTFEDDEAPELIVDSMDRKRLYNFYETITVKGRAKDRSNNDNVKVFFRFNFTDAVEIDTSLTPKSSRKLKSDDGWRYFEHTINVPQQDGEFFLVVYAKDNNGATSIDTRHDFKVKHEPCIRLRNSMERSYMPGDSVTITGFAGDFDPGKKLKIFYKLSNEDKVEVGEFVVNENQTTSDFSFNINVPESVTPQSFKIWAEESGNVAAILDKGYSVINLTPSMKILNKVNQFYYNSGFIDLVVNVTDNTRVQLWYCIDGNREINLTDFIECNGETKTIVQQIELPPRSLSFDSHKLYIFVRDEFGAESADKIYDFEFMDKNAPNLEILNITTKENYSYHDVVTLYGRVMDPDKGDKIYVNLQLNHGGYTEIFVTEATGEWQYFSYTFNVPKNDGLYVVTFQAQDNWTAASRMNRYNFKVRRSRGVQFRNTFPTYYEPKSTIHVECYLVDYEPNTKVRVKARYGKSGHEFFIDVFTIHNSMTSRDFNYQYTLPPDAKSDDLEIIIIDDDTNETLNTIKQPIVINEKPQIWLRNQFPSKLAGSSSVGLDIVITDDTKANIRYKIDDGPEYNLSDLIICNTLNKSVRKSIKIPDDIGYKKHTIHIYAVDELGLMSEVNSTEFYFYNTNFNPPILEASILDEKSVFLFNDEINIKGFLSDKDIDDDVIVNMRFDFDEFIKVHECTYNNRSNCESFNIHKKVPRVEGPHDVILQAIDSRGSTSEDVVFKITVAKHPVRTAVPPPNHPRPSPLPKDYTGSVYKTFIITYIPSITTDINGDPYTTYIPKEIEIGYGSETNTTKEDIEIGFFDTTFGKYILWPIIVAAILILVGVVVLIIIFTKKKNGESSNDLSVDMQEETLQRTTQDESMITNDNPLFGNTNDDPFKEDFQEDDRLVMDNADVVDQSDDEEISEKDVYL